MRRSGENIREASAKAAELTRQLPVWLGRDAGTLPSGRSSYFHFLDEWEYRTVVRPKPGIRLKAGADAPPSRRIRGTLS